MSPLLETSIEGARGVIMNITGGGNLSLYEVNEAAEIVISASDPEVNMIFGAIIDENMKEEIKVTVIATGFENKPLPNRKPAASAPGAPEPQDSRQASTLRPFGNQPSGDQLDIPTFLRNRSRNNNE
ncbi:Cell division protein FtsZ [compost metagenome]